jgi:hypothetical protein
MTTPRFLALAAAALMAMTPGLAQAYGGPGVGLGAISVVLGIIGSVFLMTVSLIWYPVKRLIRSMRGRDRAAAPARNSKAS